MKFEYWSHDCKSFRTYDLNETAKKAFPPAQDEHALNEEDDKE